MSNFLNSISLFSARRTDADAPGSAASSPEAADGESRPQPTSLLPAVAESDVIRTSNRSSAVNRAVASETLEASHDGSNHDSADELMPRMAYPIHDEGSAPPKVRQSRALNMLRTSTAVAVTPHPMPAKQPRGNRSNGLHMTGVVLTETERVRLQVMQVQIRLSSLALYEGPIDGMLNHDTATGLRYFQTLKCMRDTGQLTAGTLIALGVQPIV